MCLLWEVDLGLWSSWQMSTVQDPRKTWLATGSLLTVGWRMQVFGAKTTAAPCLLALAVAGLPLCLRWRGGACMQPSSPLVFTQSCVLWVGQAASQSLWLESSLFFFFSLAIPHLGLLFHISPLRLSSGYLGPVLTLSTNYAVRSSLSSPHSLVVDASVWATSLLAVLVRRDFVVVVSPSYVALWDSKTPHIPPVRGFPTFWKFLLHDSLPRMGLCP